MPTNKKQYFLYFLLLITFSCKKDLNQNVVTQSPEIVATNKENARITFSKALAKALEKEPSIRSFLKTEALKQIDLDNDVLFLTVKDQKLDGDETFYEKMLKYAISKDELENVISTLPTLTIMVPEVPNFSASTWKTESEVPLVAVDPNNKRSAVKAYDSSGKVSEIPFGSVPGYPIVVVKENERVNAKVNGIDKSPKSAILLKASSISDTKALTTSSNEGTSFYNKGGIELSFSNEAFNGLAPVSTNDLKTMRTVIITGDPTPTPFYQPIDPIVIDAFNNGLQWQRDYIYYGINPSTGVTRGPLNYGIKEYITSIKLINNRYENIGDQSGDPIPTKNSYSRPRGQIPSNLVLWTDGYYDIRISVLINASNGVGQVLNKVISAKGSDLFQLNYEMDPSPSSSWHYAGVTAKEFFINVPLVGWDLKQYGSAWKFTVSEYDLAEETTIVKSNTSTFATNFSLNASTGKDEKVGVMFGGSTTSTTSGTYTYKSTATSDDLGEGILEFGDPVIIRKETGTVINGRGQPVQTDYYTTWDVNTGSILLSIEPRKVF